MKTENDRFLGKSACCSRAGYDSDFVIKQTAGVGIEFDIVPVKGNASYDSSRSDIQHLNVKIGAVHGPGGMKPGAKPFGKDKTKL